jgi:hypothetical protein
VWHPAIRVLALFDGTPRDLAPLLSTLGGHSHDPRRRVVQALRKGQWDGEGGASASVGRARWRHYMRERTVPGQWTDVDRRRFLTIARRRKEEHVSAYAVVSIGAQLFLKLNDNHVITVNNEGEDDAKSTPIDVRDSDADVDPPSAADTTTTA